MTSALEYSNFKILRFLLRGSLSNTTSYDLNAIGLLLIQMLSVMVSLSGSQAFANRDGQIMSSTSE